MRGSGEKQILQKLLLDDQYASDKQELEHQPTLVMCSLRAVADPN